MRRILAMLLVIAMLTGMFPAVYASDVEEGTQPAPEIQEEITEPEDSDFEPIPVEITEEEPETSQEETPLSEGEITLPGNPSCSCRCNSNTMAANPERHRHHHHKQCHARLNRQKHPRKWRLLPVLAAAVCRPIACNPGKIPCKSVCKR